MKYDAICSKVTAKVVELLETGTIPWHKPWSGSVLEPSNVHSKKEYKGWNSFLLSCSAYTSSYWGTFNQIKKLGGELEKGSKGWPIIFWSNSFMKKEKDPVTGKKKEVVVNLERPILKYYTVFNIEQTNIAEKFPNPEPEIQIDFKPVEEAEKAIALAQHRSKTCEIKHNEPRAYYRPGDDIINLPIENTFKSIEEYYSTKFHEIVHSTGHPKRLNRMKSGTSSFFGSMDYSFEELVAEMGSAFLMRNFQIESKGSLENSAAYIKGWLSALKKNPDWIVKAASKSQQAMTYLLS